MNNNTSLANEILKEIVFENNELTISKLRDLKADLFDVFSKYTTIEPDNLKLNVKMLWSSNIVFMVDCVAENVVIKSDKL